jgi:hypothetical protein
MREIKQTFNNRFSLDNKVELCYDITCSFQFETHNNLWRYNKMGPQVTVIHLEEAISVKCRQCGKEFSKGHWVVGIQTPTTRHLLRKDPRFVCCGEAKDAPVIFPSEEIANGVRDALLHNLSVGRSVDSFPFCSGTLADLSD